VRSGVPNLLSLPAIMSEQNWHWGLEKDHDPPSVATDIRASPPPPAERLREWCASHAAAPEVVAG
jgi:hypothetical protein